MMENQYKTKHIVSLNKYLLIGNSVYLDIDGIKYRFKVEDVMTYSIDCVSFIKHGDIRSRNGPLEKELFKITYGKSRSQMDSWQYAKSLTTFKMDVQGYVQEFEVKGVGNKAVRVDIFISFKEIDDAKKDFCKELKNDILETYEDEINRNKSKLDDLKKEDEEEEAEIERIREEIRKEKEEKDEKYKDIAHLL
jgi:hypothetical protein